MFLLHICLCHIYGYIIVNIIQCHALYQIRSDQCHCVIRNRVLVDCRKCILRFIPGTYQTTGRCCLTVKHIYKCCCIILSAKCIKYDCGYIFIILQSFCLYRILCIDDNNCLLACFCIICSNGRYHIHLIFTEAQIFTVNTFTGNTVVRLSDNYNGIIRICCQFFRIRTSLFYRFFFESIWGLIFCTFKCCDTGCQISSEKERKVRSLNRLCITI